MPAPPTLSVSGKKLRDFREKTLIVTRRALASVTDRSPESIKRYETDGINPVPGEFLIALAKYAEIGFNDLRLKLLPKVGEKLNGRKLPGDARRTKPRDLDQNIEKGTMVHLVDIPTFDRDLAAGKWTEAIFVDEGEITQPQLEQGLFRVHLRGDSMEEKYADGSLVEFRVVRVCREGLVEGGDFYIHRDDEMATFKTVVKIDDETVTLRAINKRKYPQPMMVERSRIVRCARAVAIVKAV